MFGKEATDLWRLFIIDTTAPDEKFGLTSLGGKSRTHLT
jgi:hypothetical protein